MAKKKSPALRSVGDALASPQTRQERYLANIAGLVATKPEYPFTRLERYLDAIAQSTGGSAEAISELQEQMTELPNLYAPAGYGLGSVNGASLTETDNIDTIYKGGFYYRSSNITPLGTLPPDGWFNSLEFILEVYPTFASRNSAFQRITSYNAASTREVSITCQRLIVSGSAMPWEYINPPLELNVEYLTVERFGQEPVYIKALQLGDLPAAGGRTDLIAPASDGRRTCISAECFLATPANFAGGQHLYTIPYFGYATTPRQPSIIASIYNGAIIVGNIDSNDDWSNYKLYSIAKYI